MHVWKFAGPFIKIPPPCVQFVHICNIPVDGIGFCINFFFFFSEFCKKKGGKLAMCSRID